MLTYNFLLLLLLLCDSIVIWDILWLEQYWWFQRQFPGVQQPCGWQYIVTVTLYWVSQTSVFMWLRVFAYHLELDTVEAPLEGHRYVICIVWKSTSSILFPANSQMPSTYTFIPFELPIIGHYYRYLLYVHVVFRV